MNVAASSGMAGGVGASQLRFFVIRSSRRRSLQLSVGVHGVEVRAPAEMDDRRIDAFIMDKRRWIERAMRATGVVSGQPDVLASGGLLYFLGEARCLEIVAAGETGPLLQELSGGWRVAGDRDAAWRLLVKWYKLKAAKMLAGVLADWALRMGIPVPGCMVKEQKRLWGSYSLRTKTVRLNWRIVAFPQEIIEYIVIHELCHVRRLHHGQSFWDEVSRYCPCWRARRSWLRTDARKYSFPVRGHDYSG